MHKTIRKLGLINSVPQETKTSQDDDIEKSLYIQRLDSLMLKVQMLKDSTTEASLARRQRSPFKQGSPLSPQDLDARDLPSVRIASVTAAHFLQLNKEENARLEIQRHKNKLSPGQAPPATISPKMVGLAYHEEEAEELSRASTQQMIEKERSLSAANYSLFESEAVNFQRRSPQPEKENRDRPLSEAIEVVSTTEETNQPPPPPGWSPTPVDQPSDYPPDGIDFSHSRDLTEGQSPGQNFYSDTISSHEDIDYRADRLQCTVCHKFVKTRSELK